MAAKPEPIERSEIDAMIAASGLTLTPDVYESFAELMLSDITAGPKEIARTLEMIKELDSVRAKRLLDLEETLRAQGLEGEALDKALADEKARLIRERRETIARTETADVQGNAKIAEGEARGATLKVWITSSGRPCEDCLANAAAGAIPLKDEFPGGVMSEPQHPNCECSTQTFVSERAAGIVGKNSQEQSAKISAEIEKEEAQKAEKKAA